MGDERLKGRHSYTCRENKIPKNLDGLVNLTLLPYKFFVGQSSKEKECKECKIRYNSLNI